MTDYPHLANQLAASYGPSFCAQLGESPIKTLRSHGIRVEPFNAFPYQEGDCSCDGIFHPGPPPAIGYRPTPHSRRDQFTLIHEFGHYAVRHDDDVLSELAEFDDGGKETEERVCDTFAGSILVSDDIVATVLDSERPMAAHLAELYDQSHGSREACAVRLAERLPGFGYVVIADPHTKPGSTVSRVGVGRRQSRGVVAGGDLG